MSGAREDEDRDEDGDAVVMVSACLSRPCGPLPWRWGIWWGAANPWSWVAPFVLVCVGTLALSRPVCRMVHLLVARWPTTVIPAGYRQTGPVTQLSTG